MSLFKWEMRQMLRTKAFWFVGGAILFLMLIFHCEEFLDGGVSGFELFISLCNDFSSLSMFFVGIFAGLHVTGSLEERRMQAAAPMGIRASPIAHRLASAPITPIAFCAPR